MIANPSLIELASTPMLALFATIKTGLGLALISYGLIGFSNIIARALAIIAGLIAIFLGLSWF